MMSIRCEVKRIGEIEKGSRDFQDRDEQPCTGTHYHVGELQGAMQGEEPSFTVDRGSKINDDLTEDNTLRFKHKIFANISIS